MGPNYSISTACATSNFCILNAADHIIRGEAVSVLYSTSALSMKFARLLILFQACLYVSMNDLLKRSKLEKKN